MERFMSLVRCMRGPLLQSTPRVGLLLALINLRLGHVRALPLLLRSWGHWLPSQASRSHDRVVAP